MLPTITITIKNNSILADVSKTKANVEEAMLKGIQDGADELRDYIKDDLLSGGLVKERSGQLRNSLYIKRSHKKLTIFFRGTHSKKGNDEWEIPNAVLAEILEEGLQGSWYQPKRRQWHHGIKPHYFMRKGLQRKKKRIKDLVTFYVLQALRKKR